MKLPQAVSVKEVCSATSLGRTKVYQLIEEGRLDRRKVGRRTLITVESIERLLEEARIND